MEEKEASVEFAPVDIRRLMHEKNPSLARLIPGFVYRLIHRIMRLDFMNKFMRINGHLMGIEFVDAVITDFGITEHIFGLDDIPERRSYIFASNHPLGGFDSLVLMKHVARRFGAFKFLVNDVLMTIPNLRPVFVPINKHGGNSKDTARLLASTYESGEQILIFPSGYASRMIKGNIVDLEWQKHFIVKSVQYKRDVVPVFISGRNSGRFYWLAKIRTFFRVGWNLEMFLLPDETYRHRNKRVQLYFGKPIPWETFDRSRTQQEWAAWVRDKVYALPDGES
jgi:putative hemolysin